MARMLAALLLAVVANAALAGEDGAALGQVAEKIRSGAIDVGGTYSMSPAKGRFHRVHAGTLGLSCSSCHGGSRYPDDYLLVGKERPGGAAAQGRIDRGSCLGCHREGSEGTAFYPATAPAE